MLKSGYTFGARTILTTQPSRFVRFANYELDTRAGELRADNQTVHLQQQPLQILMMLLDRAGEVVTREELHDCLWPGSVAGDLEDNLNHAVRRLREALGDSADHPKFIETLPRRGYRFIAPINGAREKNAAAETISEDLNHVATETSRTVETLQTSATDPKSEVERVSRIWKQWLITAVAAGLIFCAALAFGIWLVLPATKQPHIVRSTQLTNGGTKKCCLVTDGPRLYFSDDAPIKYIPVAGGDAITVPTPWVHSFSWYFIVDLSPDHDKLLFTLAKTPGACSLWVVPVTGLSPRELTDLHEPRSASENSSPIALNSLETK